MNFEHIMARNVGKKAAKLIFKSAKKEKKKLEKNGHVFIEFDEYGELNIISDNSKLTFRTLRCFRGDDCDEYDTIVYNSFIEGLYKRCGKCAILERDGMKVLQWKL